MGRRLKVTTVAGVARKPTAAGYAVTGPPDLLHGRAECCPQQHGRCRAAIDYAVAGGIVKNLWRPGLRELHHHTDWFSGYGVSDATRWLPAPVETVVQQRAVDGIGWAGTTVVGRHRCRECVGGQVGCCQPYALPAGQAMHQLVDAAGFVWWRGARCRAPDRVGLSAYRPAGRVRMVNAGVCRPPAISRAATW